MKNVLVITLLFSTLISCSANVTPLEVTKTEPQKPLEDLETAYFASGCFWCVEAVFESVRGVEEAVSGYSGGSIKHPTYSQVSSGRTNHAEAVKVYYDPNVVSFETLVDVFFNSHDPTTLNRQGPDSGPQYRSIAFYQNDEEKKVIEQKISALLSAKKFPKIATQVIAFEVFYEAEDYHQDYERNNPKNAYVQNVSIPRLNKFKAAMPEVLK